MLGVMINVIGLLISILLFNFLAFRLNKHLNKNQLLHVYIFSIAFQLLFDIIIDFKLHAYWYFTIEIEWDILLYAIFLVPPVNIIFLNYFPFKKSFLHKIMVILLWNIAFLLYEFLTLSPEPWGYFHYGWWKWWYSALLNPVLLLIVLKYFRCIKKIESSI